MTAAPFWRIAAARRAGEAHERRGERCQDAFRAVLRGGTLIAAVADGAGSAARGGAGAALICRAAVSAAAAGTRALSDLDEAAARGWALAARAAALAAAERTGAPARDLAATLILVASDGATTFAAHVGDGAAVLRDGKGAWAALSWPEGGAYAGETRFLTEPEPAIRLRRHDGPVTALALLTDGLERLVLHFADETPHAPFFDRMAAPLDRLARPGRDPALSRALGRWLGAEGVAARTDDDRTLLLAARAP